MIDYDTKLLYLMRIAGGLSAGAQITLKEDVNPQALYDAVQKSRRRYPYLFTQVEIEDETYVLVDNPRPLPVLPASDPLPDMGSEEMNGHLLSVYYEGGDVYFMVLHNLGGAVGFKNWALSVIYQYIMDTQGVEPEWPSVRKPYEDPLPEEGFVGRKVPNTPDTPPTFEGFADEVNPISTREMSALLPGSGERGEFLTQISIPLRTFVPRMRECGATPSVYTAALLFKAASRVLPDIPAWTNMALANDISADFGLSPSMSLLTKFLNLVYSREDAALPIPELCKKGRVLMDAQKDPGLNAAYLREEIRVLEDMERAATLEEKASVYLQQSIILDVTPSMLVSYVGRFEDPTYEKYLDDIWIRANNAQGSILLNSFYDHMNLSFYHQYRKDPLRDALADILFEEGLEPSIGEPVAELIPTMSL